MTPAVNEDAVSVTLVTEQVNAAGVAMLTSGGVIAWVTVTEAEALQPFEGSVTVREYDPGTVTVFVLVVTPPPQS